jgi:Mrp family chromosome partitioning ATPase
MAENTATARKDGNIKHMVAVMSGKGGVGKSVVTSLLAIALQRQGLRVGILDGDLLGPSIVGMFGTEIELSMSDEGNILPLSSEHGVKIMSMSMFLESEADPTAWQGTMVASAFKQFYGEVEWDQLDYLLIDVPPGTSDVPMTILRSLPLDGVVIVSSPQGIATTVVKKCINMVHQFNVPIVGVVENMAYYMAPGGEYCEIFGPSNEAALVALAGAPLLGQLPLDPRLATLCDAGRIEEYRVEAYKTVAANFLDALQISR